MKNNTLYFLFITLILVSCQTKEQENYLPSNEFAEIIENPEDLIPLRLEYQNDTLNYFLGEQQIEINGLLDSILIYLENRPALVKRLQQKRQNGRLSVLLTTQKSIPYIHVHNIILECYHVGLGQLFIQTKSNSNKTIEAVNLSIKMPFEETYQRICEQYDIKYKSRYNSLNDVRLSAIDSLLTNPDIIIQSVPSEHEPPPPPPLPPLHSMESIFKHEQISPFFFIFNKTGLTSINGIKVDSSNYEVVLKEMIIKTKEQEKVDYDDGKFPLFCADQSMNLEEWLNIRQKLYHTFSQDDFGFIFTDITPWELEYIKKVRAKYNYDK